MYSQSNPTAMAPPQKPETFMLSDAAQHNLPQDAQVALQQVDNREQLPFVFSEDQTMTAELPALRSLLLRCRTWANCIASQIFPHLCSRGLDLWSVYQKVSVADGRVRVVCLLVRHLINVFEHRVGGFNVSQEQFVSYLRHRYCAMSLIPIPSLRTARQESKEIRRRHLLRSAQSQVWHRRIARGAKEPVPRLHVQEQLHQNPKEAEGVSLV